MRSTRLLLVLPALALTLACESGRAALGEPATSIRADAVHMHAGRTLASRGAYEVHELTLGSGTTVREYLVDDVVFAVAWQGPTKPDLNRLLGSHFARLVDAGRQPHADHRVLGVHDADLVVRSVGRMRAFAGVAYLPRSMPAGVLPGDLR